MPSNSVQTHNAKTDKTVVELSEQDDRKSKNEEASDGKNACSITIADIIGEFGYYQLSIAVIAFIRYITVALMTSTGPLIAPAVDFSCQVPDTIKPQIRHEPNVSIDDYLKSRCNYNLADGRSFECTSWSYNTTKYGVTLTDSFDLVCDRNFLRSLFQSTVTLGVVISSVAWGAFSDTYGRKLTIQVTFICSLISGIISYFARNWTVYTISRSICSFSDLGLVVSLATIMVELLGNKYRGAVCIVVYTGWAFGVAIVSWLVEYYKDYRELMLFTIVLHLLTFPWLMTIKESVRWSLVNGRISEASYELRRISKWNRKGDEASLEAVDKKFDQYKLKYLALAQRNKSKQEVTQSALKGGYKVAQLFQTRELAITTITLVWITFNSELLYMFFILINSDIGENVILNYVIGVFMETLAIPISIFMIAKTTRRVSLVTILVIISGSCLALAFNHNLPVASIWNMNLSKLAISTLSSLIYVVTTEIFPTSLRQTGFGLAGTLGSLGGAVAPWVREQLVDLIGMTNVLLILLFLPLTAAIITPYFLRETKGVELSDDVDEIEN